MESVVKNLIIDENAEKPKVGLMVMPGFWIGGSVIQSRVYLSGMKVAEWWLAVCSPCSKCLFVVCVFNYVLLILVLYYIYIYICRLLVIYVIVLLAVSVEMTLLKLSVFFRIWVGNINSCMIQCLLSYNRWILFTAWICDKMYLC